LQPFVPKGKLDDYYDLMRRELGYITPYTQFESETEESLSSHSSDSLDWEPDVSMGVVSRIFSPT